MSTFYLDYEGGSDAADGLSFANRWKTLTLGATAARIAPGDTIRIMGSPAPTSLAINGTWTDGPLAATSTITSSTNATPIVITKASHGLTTGDTVVVTGHTTNTNANGTWEVTNLTSSTFSLDTSVGNGVGGTSGTFRLRNNSRVMLASAVTQSIQDCGFQSGAWTASANVTATITTSDFKEGYGSSSLAVAAGFATGLAAYKALGAITDFSAYKQISFWIKQTAGTIGAAGATTISLCSDAIGAVAVNTVNVPNLAALNVWVPITVDTGGALSAIIQSVAFNIVTDNGAQTFLVDNITACKDSTSADALSLQSLIGKNTGTETWCGIQSINGTRVMMDQDYSAMPTTTTYRGYSGTTETVTAYKKETIKTVLATSQGSSVQLITDSGTLGSLISFEGGWDRTAMTTQNLDTWFDGVNGWGDGIVAVSRSYFSINKISGVRYRSVVAIAAGCNNCSLDNIHANNCLTSLGAISIQGAYGVTIGSVYSASYNNGPGVGIVSGSNNVEIGTIYAVNGTSLTAVSVGQTTSIARDCYIASVTTRNNGGVGVGVSATNCVFDSITSNGNASAGISFSTGSDNIVRNLVTTGNAYGVAQNAGFNYLVNASIAESTEVNPNTGLDIYTASQDHDTTVGNHQIFTDNGRISSDTTTRHTASGICWKMAPTSTLRSSLYPLVLSISKIACKASALVTVSAWMRRTNTGLTMRLVCKGGQIAGVASDVASSMTAAADTYEQLTITFTPSAAGIVEIIAEAYGGTTYSGYVDDVTLSQA